ncbi:MAG: hypothetical protein BMS9Abin33_1128 [Gammaproteobacteria bacterium]|nr:MAG: hypothetical protein BMS9Abin33_1128 [Gammaproteobacteria bacterium]
MTYESQAINQAGQNQLDLVAAKFEDWRRQKTSRSSRIPEALLREAKNLSQHLGATVVRRRLGITKGQMDKLDASKLTDNVAQEADFMQLVPSHSQIPHPEFTIDICTPNGVKISLSGLSHKDPLALIATLIDVQAC